MFQLLAHDLQVCIYHKDHHQQQYQQILEVGLLVLSLASPKKFIRNVNKRKNLEELSLAVRYLEYENYAYHLHKH